jgi:hypothetical protein
MTTQNQNTTVASGDNHAAMLDALKRKMQAHGALEAKGNASRVDAAKDALIASFNGDIDEGDAAELYAAYAAGAAKAAGKNPNAVLHASEKQQVSKLRQFIKLGALPNPVDGRDVVARAEARIAAHRSNEADLKPPYDALLDVARQQVKAPDAALTDEEIDLAVLRPEKVDKSDLDKLVAAYKAAHKLAEKLPLPGTQAAVDAYANDIREMGGDVPPMTKEEKAEAEAMQFLAKRGMVATYALAAE